MSRDENVLLSGLAQPRRSAGDDAAAAAQLPQARNWWNDFCRSAIEAWGTLNVCPGYHRVLADEHSLGSRSQTG